MMSKEREDLVRRLLDRYCKYLMAQSTGDLEEIFARDKFLYVEILEDKC